MSALAAIIAEYAQTCRDHPNALGEILRAWAFPGEGYGCYSTFDVRPELTPVTPTEREFGFLWGRAFESEQPSSDYFSVDAEEIKRVQWFKHPSGIEVGWHWDGDGVLAFFVPELADEDYTGVIRNGDCKKDYEWEFEPVPYGQR